MYNGKEDMRDKTCQLMEVIGNVQINEDQWNSVRQEEWNMQIKRLLENSIKSSLDDSHKPKITNFFSDIAWGKYSIIQQLTLQYYLWNLTFLRSK